MSPMPQPRSGKIAPASNLYTVILAIAFAIVLVTFAYVVYACKVQYGALFGVS
jgi:hypothetical protein